MISGSNIDLKRFYTTFKDGESRITEGVKLVALGMLQRSIYVMECHVPEQTIELAHLASLRPRYARLGHVNENGNLNVARNGTACGFQ